MATEPLLEVKCNVPFYGPAECFAAIYRSEQGGKEQAIVILGEKLGGECYMGNLAGFMLTETLWKAEALHGLCPLEQIHWYATNWTATLQKVEDTETANIVPKSWLSRHFNGGVDRSRTLWRVPVRALPLQTRHINGFYKHNLDTVDTWWERDPAMADNLLKQLEGSFSRWRRTAYLQRIEQRAAKAA